MSLVGTLGREEVAILNRRGQEYRLARPTVGAILAVEREYRKHNPGPLAKAAMHAKHVPVEHAAAYWAAAYRSEAIEADSCFMDDAPSIYKLPLTVLLLLHRHHRDEVNTIEQAADWLANIDLEEFQQASLILNPPKPHARPTEAPAPTGLTSSEP